MNHAYLTKKDIDVARIVGQITKEEVKELLLTLEKCKKFEKIGNIILHNVL